MITREAFIALQEGDRITTPAGQYTVQHRDQEELDINYDSKPRRVPLQVLTCRSDATKRWVIWADGQMFGIDASELYPIEALNHQRARVIDVQAA